MKFIKQKFTAILLTLAFLVGAISTVNFALKTEAASQAIGDLTVDYPSSPLFDATNIAPGYEEVKTISVTNNGSVEHSFSIDLDGATGPLADVIHFIPKTLLGDIIWDHTLSEIVASPDGFVVFDKIPAGQTAVFNLTATLPTSVGNAYQGKSVTTFGIILGVDSSYSYTEPTIPVFGLTGESGGTGSTGGTSAGSVGRGLALGTAGITEETPAITETPNEQPGEVLGETSEAEKGEETSGKIICYWWWLLSIIYAVLLLIYGWIFYKRELMFDWLWPVVGGVIFYFLHWYLHRFYTPSKWCPYFVWFELAILIIYFVIYNYFKNRAEEE